MAVETASGSATPAQARPVPGESPYHESSQFKHWRYSRAGLATLRLELNERSKEVTARNQEAEKAAQESLGHKFTSPPPTAAYLSVDDELLLVRFYCSHASTICRQGFGLPESVEATAMSYIKRFYLKNSVMEWHPKNIMPTCLFLAAKTTNHPIPIDVFVSKLQGFKANDVLDLEFLVAQSLAFEFWIRGADKALRGWSLELQSAPSIGGVRAPERVQRSLPSALNMLSNGRLTDAEFLYSPSQVGLACWRLADRELVDAFMDQKYAVKNGNGEANGAENGSPALSRENSQNGTSREPYGVPRAGLERILDEVEALIIEAGDGKFDLKMIKGVDKRLKGCTNPEKVPGTALYIKRKAEQEAKAAEEKAAKSARLAEARVGDELVFGAPLKKEGMEGLGAPLKGEDPFGAPLERKSETTLGGKEEPL